MISAPLGIIISQASKQIFARNLLVLKFLDDLRESASRVCARRIGRLDFLPMRGAAALLTIYKEDPWERPMEDVDLLVRPAALDEWDAFLRRSGFSPRPSGEYVYHKPGMPFPVDLHPGLWYLDPAGVDALFARSRRATPLKVPSPEDLFIDAVAHAAGGHGTLRPAWAQDMRRLLPECDAEILRARLHETGMSEAAGILWDRAVGGSSSRVGAPVFFAAGRTFRGMIMKLFLNLPDCELKGHAARFTLLNSVRARIGWLRERFWPDRSFLARRYQDDSAAIFVQRIARPFRMLRTLAADIF